MPGARPDPLLACPLCRAPLLGAGPLACSSCPATFPLDGGLPRLHDAPSIRGPDRFMRALYDTLGALHDPGVRYALPLVDGTSEDTLRRRLVAWLDLDRLGARSPGEDPTVNILEVGIGSGANLPYLADALPPDREAVVWGVDLSATMLAKCVRRARSAPLDVRLAFADAHALPFADGVFDRVFHAGGIGSYRDPRAALAEMARVARPGTPIVVADEALDRRADPGLLAHLAFRTITFNQWRPRAPVEALPPEAVDVEVEALSTFYYVLRFACAA